MGKNIWVSLNIPDEYRGVLDEINKQIKTTLNERYDTMDYNMYHMTTLFLGKNNNNINNVLHKKSDDFGKNNNNINNVLHKKSDDFGKNNNNINNVLHKKSDDFGKNNNNINNVLHKKSDDFSDKFRELKNLDQLLHEYDESEYILEFDEITMFPPDKQNLLVVKFKQNIKLKNDINFMKKIIENNDPVADFLPHITLGKLRTTKSDKNEFSKIVKNIIDEINKQNKQNTSYNFTGRGFYLCGDI